MFKIGIIGTESSHALAFAKYYNLPDPETGKFNHEDVRVTAIYGTDEEANKKTAEAAGIELIVEKPEDLIGIVDAVMITSRWGSQHYEQALPFVEKGIPLFIDKPFTSDPAEADALMAKIIEHNCPVMGGSVCKYLPDIKKIKALVAQLREEGTFNGASMSFRITLDSPYDGIYFYAPHLVEMCLEAFGFDVKNIQAMRTGNNLLVNVQYENDAVSLQFVASGNQSALIYSKAQNYHFDIDLSGLYALEAAPFAELLHGNQESLTAEQMVKPIHMIAAIKEAMETGKIIKM